MINPPTLIKATGRAANAERFANIPDVVTPKMALLPRGKITAAELQKRGFAFPLLLRAPGFHSPGRA